MRMYGACLIGSVCSEYVIVCVRVFIRVYVCMCMCMYVCVCVCGPPLNTG